MFLPNVKNPLTRGPSTSPITTVKPVNSDLYLCTGILPLANTVLICFNDAIFFVLTAMQLINYVDKCKYL